MKKNSIIALLGLVAAFETFAAAPTLMVLPDKAWCKANGFLVSETFQGQTQSFEDFDAVYADEGFVNVVSSIKEIFAVRDFPLVDFNATKSIRSQVDAFRELYESALTGSELANIAFESVMSSSNPDIALRLGWTTEESGFNRIVHYRLDAVDAYSGKSVATISGSSAPFARNASLTVNLRKAIDDNLRADKESMSESAFLTQLQKHFDKIQNVGREIRVNLDIVDNGSGLNFYQEFGEDDEELAEIIRGWMAANTVNSQFSDRTTSRNHLEYTGVIIPYRDDKGVPQQARQFVNGLRRFLKRNYGIASENNSSGPGFGLLQVGE